MQRIETVAEHIIIDDFRNSSSAGTGRVEYLNVTGTNYWFNDVASGIYEVRFLPRLSCGSGVVS